MDSGFDPWYVESQPEACDDQGLPVVTESEFMQKLCSKLGRLRCYNAIKALNTNEDIKFNHPKADKQFSKVGGDKGPKPRLPGS